MPRPAGKHVARLLIVLVAAFSLTLLHPLPRYVLRAGWGQATLLVGRTPLDSAITRPDLTETERARLRLVGPVKAFGESVIGLSPTRNYEAVALDRVDPVWNVSACAADRFVSHMFRYPWVGALPYTGFFDRDEADDEAAKLRALGWEAHVRPAGAYSTLGWFEDPLWRSMLGWDEGRFVETVLHELSHATIWLPGHGDFSESVAQFVGEEATIRFLEAEGPAMAGAAAAYRDGHEDGALYVASMHALYERLDGLYAAGLPRAVVLRERERVIAEARRRWQGLPWRSGRYRAAMDPDRVIDNPTLVQFRVYRTGGDRLRKALDRFGGDLPALLRALRTIPDRADQAGFDPWREVDRLDP
jgi:predicted aminopeptidase